MVYKLQAYTLLYYLTFAFYCASFHQLSVVLPVFIRIFDTSISIEYKFELIMEVGLRASYYCAKSVFGYASICVLLC